MANSKEKAQAGSNPNLLKTIKGCHEIIELQTSLVQQLDIKVEELEKQSKIQEKKIATYVKSINGRRIQLSRREFSDEYFWPYICRTKGIYSPPD
jgi:hypothetical protein